MQNLTLEQVQSLIMQAKLDAIKSYESKLADAAAVAAKSSVEQTGSYLMQLIESVEARLNAIKAPEAKAIKVNELPKVELDKPAHKLLPRLIKNALLKKATLIKGPAGSGKTTVAEQVAQALGLKFYRFVFSPDMGVSSLFGRQTPTGFVESIIVQAIRNGGVLLLDEMDAAAPELLIAINALADRGATVYNTVTGDTLLKHKDLVVIACCNTWGKGADGVYTGRSRLDGATLDRYLLAELDYCEQIESQIAASYGPEAQKLLTKLQEARKALRSQGAEEFISTRKIVDVLDLVFIGEEPESEAFASFTLSWPEGLADAVGLIPEKPKAKKAAKTEGAA